jgi:hypothetical protein
MVPSKGLVVVEAEDLEYSSKWKFKNSPSGFTGTGYVVAASSNGVGHEKDPDGRYQGKEVDRLNVHVFIPEEGQYNMDCRNYHKQYDGDNDLWLWVKGYPPPIPRAGGNSKQVFTWLEWGQHKGFNLKRGLYTFYVAMRSSGMGVDRISLWDVNSRRGQYYSKIATTAVTQKTAIADTAGTVSVNQFSITRTKDGIADRLHFAKGIPASVSLNLLAQKVRSSKSAGIYFQTVSCRRNFETTSAITVTLK